MKDRCIFEEEAKNCACCTHADKELAKFGLIKDTIRDILHQLRWDDQGGYPGYNGDGKWNFVSSGVQITPDQLNQLFDFIGEEPDKIVSIGYCQDCLYSIGGGERGYKEPCLSCKRPRMSNFKAKTTEMPMVYCQQWIEYERGWGQRKDGVSLHTTPKIHKKYLKDELKGRDKPGPIPDEYSNPEGDVVPVRVTKLMHEYMRRNGGSVRLWKGQVKFLENDDGEQIMFDPKNFFPECCLCEAPHLDGGCCSHSKDEAHAVER